MIKNLKTPLLTIGQFAKASREAKTTIRFWTDEKLVEINKHTDSGYALYSPNMLSRVKMIRQLQDKERLTISEIRDRVEKLPIG